MEGWGVMGRGREGGRETAHARGREREERERGEREVER